jgi:urease accessory protein
MDILMITVTTTIMVTITITTSTTIKTIEDALTLPEGEAGDNSLCSSRKGDDPSALSPSGVACVEGEFDKTQALLKLHSWLSPSFPIGAYSYSHGLEWAVEARTVHDRATLVDWLDADLRFGAGRNDGIFFREAWRRVQLAGVASLVELAELAAAYRGTSEFALEASQQGSACLATIRRAWPHQSLEALASALAEAGIPLTLAISLGSACGAHGIEIQLALPLYLQSYAANLVTAALRLIPLGQTDGQLALAALEASVAATSTDVFEATLSDLGSAAFMIDLASMAHETQYTRLFRS